MVLPASVKKELLKMVKSNPNGLAGLLLMGELKPTINEPPKPRLRIWVFWKGGAVIVAEDVGAPRTAVVLVKPAAGLVPGLYETTKSANELAWVELEANTAQQKTAAETRTAWERNMTRSPLVRRIVGSRVGRYSDFWHQIYSPAFSVWMALHPEYFRGWAFVTSYSSATVAESHGVPCTDVFETKTSQRTARSVSRTLRDFKKIRVDGVAALDKLRQWRIMTHVEFIETPVFTREITRLLPDDSYRRLQFALFLQPDAGDLIRGSGGLRKIRWELPG